MFFLPPLNFKLPDGASFDEDVLIDFIKEKGRYPNGQKDVIIEAYKKRERGRSSWFTSEDFDECKAHYRRLGFLYHPDTVSKEEEHIRILFQALFADINKDRDRIEQGLPEENFEESSSFKESYSPTKSSKVSAFARKNTQSTGKMKTSIELYITLSQIYNQEIIDVPEAEGTIRCTGDMYNGLHRIVKDRDTIIRIVKDPTARKQDLDYIVTLQTTPLQILYMTEKVTLPNGKEIIVKPGSTLVFEGLGFTGRDGSGDLIIEFKICATNNLTKEQKQKLHALNLEIYYKKE